VGQAHLLGAAGFHGARAASSSKRCASFAAWASAARALASGRRHWPRPAALRGGRWRAGRGGLQLGGEGGDGGIGLLLAGGELGVLEAGQHLAGLTASPSRTFSSAMRPASLLATVVWSPSMRPLAWIRPSGRALLPAKVCQAHTPPATRATTAARR
jgi:hypothetical protein